MLVVLVHPTHWYDVGALLHDALSSTSEPTVGVSLCAVTKRLQTGGG